MQEVTTPDPAPQTAGPDTATLVIVTLSPARRETLIYEGKPIYAVRKAESVRMSTGFFVCDSNGTVRGYVDAAAPLTRFYAPKILASIQEREALAADLARLNAVPVVIAGDDTTSMDLALQRAGFIRDFRPPVLKKGSRRSERRTAR